MYQKDFILRIIEEFFTFLSRILKLKSGKEYEKALELIDEAAKYFLKINLNEVVQNGQLNEEILSTLSFDQLKILAELLKVKADIFNETNLRFSAVSNYQFSLGLYEHIQSSSGNYSVEVADKILEIKRILVDYK